MSRRLQYLYQIDIAMDTDHAMTMDMALDIAKRMCNYPDPDQIENTIEECEENFLRIIFRSAIHPGEMLRTVDEILADDKCAGIYYIDACYAYPYDLTPDRTVVWADGRRQEYTSNILWTETNVR